MSKDIIKKEKYKWRVSDILDDGHNGIITCWNEPEEYGFDADNRIVIGAGSPLTREQAQKICDVHNYEISQAPVIKLPERKEDKQEYDKEEPVPNEHWERGIKWAKHHGYSKQVGNE